MTHGNNNNNKGNNMKTTYKLLTLATSLIFFPMVTVALSLGMPSGLVLFALITYITVLTTTLTK